MTKYRIVEISKQHYAEDTEFIIEWKPYFFLWWTTVWGSHAYRSIEEAERQVKFFKRYYAKTKKQVVKKYP